LEELDYERITLIEAVKAGDSAAVQALINSNVAIEQTDDYGWTALNWAAGKGDRRLCNCC